MRYLLRKPTSNKAWVMEVALDLCLLILIYSVMTAISVSVKVLVFDGPVESFDFKRELKEAPHIFTVVPIVSFLFRIWNYFPIAYFLRMKYAKQYKCFSMKKIITLIALSWLGCYWAVFTAIRLVNTGDIIRSIRHVFDIDALVVVIMPGVTASMLAPIVTYRLIGYCFDSDFSLPPWSHGRWGFGKLAPVAEPAAAETPVRADDTGPDASPPTGSRGGA